MTPYANLLRMGRKKKYKAPQGLVKMPGSPFWWIVWKEIRKSTGIPLADITKATILLLEVQKRWYEKQDKIKEILGLSIPFSKLIERYLAEISPGKKSNRSDKTNSNYPLKYFGARPIDGIKPQDIYKYFEWRKEQKSKQTKKSVSGPTMNREKSLISDAFSKAIRWGYVDGNPVAQVEGFRENKRDRYITDKEFEAIKKEARSIPNAHHLSDIMDVLYHTAQRSGKIFGLKWSQIDLKERRITFGESTSTKRVPDEIWINQTLFELLLHLKAGRVFQKVVGPYVFQKRDGKPYRSLKTTWRTCCERAGVRDARIHDIRHKALTDMAKKGYSLQQIAKAAGHTQISTTLRYTHLRAEDTKEALESLGKK
ncbi:MAG: site-specific integrase [Thermodesulfobacteriota bacterium]